MSRRGFLSAARGFRVLLFVVLAARVVDLRPLRLRAHLLVGLRVLVRVGSLGALVGACPDGRRGLRLVGLSSTLDWSGRVGIAALRAALAAADAAGAPDG